MKIRQATKSGWIDICNGGVCDLNYPHSKTRRGRVQRGGYIFPTVCSENASLYQVIKTKRGDNMADNVKRPACVTITDDNGELWDVYIRRLTPLETWRAMGFSDEAFHKAEAVCSDTRLYMQAGNSIVVPVLEAIFRQMIPEGETDEHT